MNNDQLDAHVDAILKAGGSALRHYTTQKSKDDMRAALLLAVLALRPQAVPMTPAERERELDRSPVDVSWEAGDAFMEGIYAAEAHHGITAQGAQGEQA